jgi:hypothetical protein
LNRAEFTMFMRYAWDLMQMEGAKGQVGESGVLFLGGSCNPTTWRADHAIPLLEKNGIKYYNPQVDDWYPALMAEEAKAKKTAKCMLFVVDSLTRAIASMIEVAEYVVSGRKVVLVINKCEDGVDISGSVVTGNELKDLNRGRAYLADIADRYHVPVYWDVIHATFHAIKIMQDKEVETHLLMRKRSQLGQGK